MKKLFFIVGLLSLLTFFSCQNEENVYYSCDEAEDAWVKENLSSIRKMETTEWFSISEKLKLPVYRAFSLEQKQSVWMEKIKLTLTQGVFSDGIIPRSIVLFEKKILGFSCPTAAKLHCNSNNKIIFLI